MMNPLMREKIDAVLERVRDPESDLSVAQLGLVRKLRWSEAHNHLYIFTDFASRQPGCLTCAGIAMVISASILKKLEAEFQTEFPDLTIEFL